MLPPFARRQPLNYIEIPAKQYCATLSSTPTGESVSFTYNLLDGSRKTATRTTPSGSVTTTYAYYGYDAGGNLVPDFRQGQLKSVTTNSKTISYDYDVLGNKRSMTTPGAKTVSNGYDTLNRLSTVTHSDGATTAFGYDKVGNRQSVTRVTSTGTVFSTTAYTYDPLNKLIDIVNRDGNNAIVSSYHYQLSRRQAVQRHGCFGDHALHLRRSGQADAGSGAVCHHRLWLRQCGQPAHPHGDRLDNCAFAELQHQHGLRCQ